MNILTTNHVIINYDHVQTLNIHQRSYRGGFRFEVQARIVGENRSETIRSFTDNDDAVDMINDIFSAIGKGKRIYRAADYTSIELRKAKAEPQNDDSSPDGAAVDEPPTE